MVKRIVFVLLSCLLWLSATAQEYVVKSIKLSEGDQTAVEQQRLDLVKNPCALVKVLAADKVVKVDGNVIGSVDRHGSYTWVYITDGTKRIDLHFEKHLTLSVYFPDYQVKIKSACTYVMQLAENKAEANKQTIIERDSTTGQGMYELGMDYTKGQNGKSRDHAKAFYWFQKSAATGHAAGINALGVSYRNGEGVGRDYVKAMQLFQQATEKGESKGYYNIGRLYEYGQGVERSYRKAMEFYRKSADAGYNWAQYAVGSLYYNGYGVVRNEAEAVAWFRKAADQGLAVAQYWLGWCYHDGRGVLQSYPDALSWFRKAADQKNTRAMTYLGYYFEKGFGMTAPNKEQAVYWYEQAANAGDAAAMRNMGIMCSEGIGVEVDIQKSVEWYSKAAKVGDAQAQVYLANAYQKGNGVEENPEQAFYWYQKAADQNYAEGYYFLGWCYERGTGVKKDQKKGAEYLEKAAEMGDLAAQKEVGENYFWGSDGFKKDYGKAMSWLKKASDSGKLEAAAMLGACYFEGLGTSKNKEKALEYSKKAADGGNAMGQYNLALIYLREDNPKYDRQIHELLVKSAEQKFAKSHLLLGVIEVCGLMGQPSVALGAGLIFEAAQLGDEDAQVIIKKAGLEGLIEGDIIQRVSNDKQLEQRMIDIVEKKFKSN